MVANNKTMKAWRINSFGIDHLTLEDVPVPSPAGDEILIKVNAVSLNFRDFAIVQGFYLPDLMPKDLIPVSDTSGTVVQLGSSSSKFREGDQVIVHPFLAVNPDGSFDHMSAYGGPINGGLAEYMVVKEYALIKAPANLSGQEASTLPIAALTAWFSLTNKMKLKAGDHILFKGTGGVSLFGIQFAKALGAHPIVITSSDEKGEKTKEIGADEFINYKEHENWEAKVKALTGGKGVDHVLEVVGGKSFNRSLDAIRERGNIIVVGFLEDQYSELDLMKLLSSRVNITAVSSIGNWDSWAAMLKAIEDYNIKPIVDSIYNFSDAKDAFKQLNKGVFGKIIIKISG